MKHTRNRIPQSDMEQMCHRKVMLVKIPAVAETGVMSFHFHGLEFEDQKRR